MKYIPHPFCQKARAEGSIPCGMSTKASGMKSIPHPFCQKVHAEGFIPCGMNIKTSGMNSIPCTTIRAA
jgi:hypothetical protein